jgi:phage terminase large subunit
MKLNPNFVFIEKNISEKRVLALQGGTRSGKTYSALQWIIRQCMQYKGMTISIVRATLPALKASAMRDFVEILTNLGLYSESQHNMTENVYTLNGNTIEFFSVDNEQKLRGRKRDLLFVNEANEITLEQWRQLVFRTTGRIIIDYNPSMVDSWIYDHVLTREDCGLLVTTYKDNPHLSEYIIREIEALQDADPEYWKVFGLGERGQLKDLVFNNWTQVPSMPPDAKLIGYGMDFGFSVDPTTLIEVRQQNGELWLREVLYRTNMTNTDIGNFLKQQGIARDEIVADSAEPKSIEEIRRQGFNIQPALKGPDSINNGIDILRRYKMNVTQDSLNLIKELRSYKWATDKDGKATGKPVDYMNHCFIGDTLITTTNGDVKIKDIEVGDYVLTSKGYKKVLKKFNNGVKQVHNYSMQFDTFNVNLCSTKEHEIKTINGWQQISKLKQNNVLYQCKYSMVKNIDCTPMKDILAEAEKGCIQRFGNSIMVKYQKATTYIMLMVMHITMILQTLILLMKLCICVMKVKKGLKKIQILLKNFMPKVLKRQKNGISQKKGYSGIGNMEKKHGLTSNCLTQNVQFAENNIKHHSQHEVNTVIKTAKLLHFEEGESFYSEVYDIMVEDCHEYFANGILVHNCIDSLRYLALNKLNNRPRGVYKLIGF